MIEELKLTFLRVLPRCGIDTTKNFGVWTLVIKMGVAVEVGVDEDVGVDKAGVIWFTEGVGEAIWTFIEEIMPILIANHHLTTTHHIQRDRIEIVEVTLAMQREIKGTAGVIVQKRVAKDEGKGAAAALAAAEVEAEVLADTRGIKRSTDIMTVINIITNTILGKIKRRERSTTAIIEVWKELLMIVEMGDVLEAPVPAVTITETAHTQVIDVMTSTMKGDLKSIGRITMTENIAVGIDKLIASECDTINDSGAYLLH
jgi:hypothetical protein